MYIPKYAGQEDRDLIFDFIQSYPFATIVTSHSQLNANHYPLLLEKRAEGEVLIGHMARSNHQWQEFSDKDILVLFQGPHSYISPSIYVNKLNVPTWSYTAVHVYGKPLLIHDAAKIEEILTKTVYCFENKRAEPWDYDVPRDFREKLIRAIVGFEIKIERVEAKFKLSQNRSMEDYQAVLREFSMGSDANSKELLKYMKLTKPNGY